MPHFARVPVKVFMKFEIERPLLVTLDLDDTVRAINDRPLAERQRSNQGLLNLAEKIEAEKLYRASKVGAGQLYAGIATGQVRSSLDALVEEDQIFAQTIWSDIDVLIAGVGTYIAWRDEKGKLVQSEDWPRPDATWKPQDIQAVLKRHHAWLSPQEDGAEQAAKLSYYARLPDGESITAAAGLTKLLLAKRLSAHVIISGQGEKKYCDIMPSGIDKAAAKQAVSESIGWSEGRQPYDVVGGNSLNDCALALAADYVILPSNAEADFVAWAQDPANVPPEKLCLASKPFADGIIEGLQRSGLTATF